MKISIPALFVAAVLLPWTAQAHAHLTKADPANGSTVTTAPVAVSLTFDEAATLTALSIQMAGDKAAQKLGPLPKVPNAQFTVALPKLAAGTYSVKYRVLTDDNHVMGGTTTFTISTDAKPAMNGMHMKGMDMTTKKTNMQSPSPASSEK